MNGPIALPLPLNTNRLNKSLFTGKLGFLSDCLLFVSATKFLTETVHTYIEQSSTKQSDMVDQGRAGNGR